jgi:hypothetical protein
MGRSARPSSSRRFFVAGSEVDAEGRPQTKSEIWLKSSMYGGVPMYRS